MVIRYKVVSIIFFKPTVTFLCFCGRILLYIIRMLESAQTGHTCRHKQFIRIYLNNTLSKLHRTKEPLFEPFFLEGQAPTKICAWLAQICVRLEYTSCANFAINLCMACTNICISVTWKRSSIYLHVINCTPNLYYFSPINFSQSGERAL